MAHGEIDRHIQPLWYSPTVSARSSSMIISLFAQVRFLIILGPSAQRPNSIILDGILNVRDSISNSLLVYIAWASYSASWQPGEHGCIDGIFVYAVLS